MSKADKVIRLLGLICVGFVVGVMVGERTKGSFFRPWFDDSRIYVGDKVRFRKHSRFAEDYNTCGKMTVLGFQAITNENVAWILAENCSAFPNAQMVDTDVVPVDELEKAL